MPFVQVRHTDHALARVEDAIHIDAFEQRTPLLEWYLLRQTAAYAREILDAGSRPVWEPWPAGPHPDAAYSAPAAWFDALDALPDARTPIQEYLREATRSALAAALTAHAGGQDLSASVLWWLDKRERALRPAPARSTPRT